MITKRRGLQNADDCRMCMRENGPLARQMVCQRCSIPVEEHPYARLQDRVQCNEWAVNLRLWEKRAGVQDAPGACNTHSEEEDN